MALRRPPPGAAMDEQADAGAHLRLAGAPASEGTCFGTARVVLTPAGVGSVRPGEIAVVPVLSPALIAELPHAGAIVAEVGGVLSNAAVIAREMRIPVVVAVPDATRAIASGDQLLVDGSSGAVERFRCSE